MIDWLLLRTSRRLKIFCTPGKTLRHRIREITATSIAATAIVTATVIFHAPLWAKRNRTKFKQNSNKIQTKFKQNSNICSFEILCLTGAPKRAPVRYTVLKSYNLQGLPFSRIGSGDVATPAITCHTITLSHYHDITLSHYHSITLSQYHTITVSHYHDITTTHYPSIRLSYYHDITTTDYHTIALSRYHTITISHYDNILRLPASRHSIVDSSEKHFPAGTILER